STLSWRRKQRTVVKLGNELERSRPYLWREIDQIVNCDPLPVVGGRFGREGLCCRGLLALDGGLRHRPLFNRPHRLSGHAVEDEAESVFGHLGDCLDLLAVYRNIAKVWSGREIVIPNPVMDKLVVPNALARFGVQTDQALRIQPSPGPFAAVEV